MRIVQLTAENVKRLKAVQITPDGAVVEIAGRNAQGKSSVLDAIWLALEYKNAAKLTKQPIRDGEDEARVTLDLGDLTVTRTWKKGGSSLTVKSADGVPVQRPQEMLDALVGRLSFDPLAFTQQDDRTQVATLLSLVDLPFNPAELDAERQKLYDSRHSVGQEAAKAKGAFETLPRPAPDVPETEVSTSALFAELSAAQDVVRTNSETRSLLAECQTEVLSATKALEDAKLRLKSSEQSYAVHEKRVAELPADPDLEPIRERMESADGINASVRAARDWRAAKGLHELKDAEWKQFETAIAAIDKRKADALAGVKFPVDGLGFGDGGVTYNGVPFGQASSAEQLRVSLGMAMAMNPELRVIRITDGSLLDADNLALVAEMAKDADVQVWIERVGKGSESAVVIEDGMVQK